MRSHRTVVALVVAGITLGGAMFGMNRELVAQRPTAERRAQAQQEPEVLTRGPVHEAFAEPVVFDAAAGISVREAAPEAIEEIPPAQKPAGENVVWISGYWSWDDDRGRFIWISGIWRAVPPGLEWVPGYWAETPGGWQWVSGFWRHVEQDEITYLPPPPESLEEGPIGDTPSRDHVWVSGTWLWRDTRYAWRPGFYVQYHPGWTWMPAHYVWSPRGHIFVDGYWDFEVARRGVLFAPVYFHSYYAGPDYFYSPTIVIDLNIFTNHLFARPRHHHYYFGDYYAANYFSAGFYPWFSFHMSRYGYDPIFAYASWHYGRGDVHWHNRLRDDFRFRRDHEDARPARTFAEMRTASERSGDRDGKNLVLATSLDTAASRKDSPMKFEKLSDDRRNEMTKESQELRGFREQRVKLEAKATDGKSSKTEQVQPEKVKMSKSPLAAKTSRARGEEAAPPAKPAAPKDETAIQPKPRGEKRQRPEPKLDLPGPGKAKGGESPNEAKPKKSTDDAKPPKRDSKPDKPKDDSKPPKAKPKPDKPMEELKPPKQEPKSDKPKVDPKPDKPKPETKPDKPKGKKPDKPSGENKSGKDKNNKDG